MTNDDRTTFVPRRTPESAAMVAEVRRAMAITARLNRLTFDDAADVRALFGELIGTQADDGFVLIPPFHATGGTGMKLGTTCSSTRTARSTIWADSRSATT
ncbi:acetyltransferase [Burkholderia cepacia]|nr:acetyltransferase [Burkholderia cepacia]QNN03089.1 hypothetical protein K562_10678 [Burkholderia cenocepacia]SPU93873.1 hexapaptide repeat-containing transferase [Burkholderia cenocepacia]SPV10676.1 hexapaptide repeat-containing transferase [Burkholderia cenocepacia]